MHPGRPCWRTIQCNFFHVRREKRTRRASIFGTLEPRRSGLGQPWIASTSVSITTPGRLRQGEDSAARRGSVPMVRLRPFAWGPAAPCTQPG